MALAVAFGALGAHALESVLTADSLSSYLTAVRYQVYHSLAVIILAAVADARRLSLKGPLRLMSLGMLLFSLSIYILSTRSLTGLESIGPYVGPVTPIGGLLLIGAWVWSGLTIFRTGGVR